MEELRDQIGRVLYEEPGHEREWKSLPDDRKEPWRQDADRVIALIDSLKEPKDDVLDEEDCGAEEDDCDCGEDTCVCDKG